MRGQNLIIKVLGAFIALSVLMALAAGVRAFRGGNLEHARQIATRLQVEASTTPAQLSSPAASAAGSVAAAPPALSAAAAAHAASSNSVKAPSGTPAANAAPGTTARAATSTAPPRPTTGSPAVVTAPAGVSKMVPRRQPTAGEVSQAISAVHSLVPFFTPTPAQIASAGDQVCTALDQGSSFSAVKAAALNLVGAGSYSWIIPASVPDVAVRTLVALYCPGYATKLV